MLCGCSLMGNVIVVLYFDVHEVLTLRKQEIFSKDLWDVTLLIL